MRRSTDRMMMRQLMRCALLAAGLFLAAAAVPEPAAAHLYLVGSAPADGAALDTVPLRIALTFSEPVELAFTRLELVGPDGVSVRLSEPFIAPGEPNVAIFRIDGTLRPGDYSVAWRTTSADGHPVAGGFAFAVSPGPVGLTAEPAAESLPPAPVHHDPATFPESRRFDAESPGYVAVRWISFIGLLGVVGIVAFRHLVLRIVRRGGDPGGLALLEPAAARSAWLGLGSTLLLAAAAAARLYAQSLALNGPGAALEWESISAVLTRTLWGWGWLAHIAGVIAVAVGLGIALRARAGRPDAADPGEERDPGAGWLIAAAGAVLLAFTPALSGHAAAVPELGTLAMLADGLHVLGAGGWLGSLLAVILIGVPVAMRLEREVRGPAIAALVRAFSPTALAFAALVTVTGVVSATFHLGSVPDLWQSEYGRVLLLKLAVLSLVFALGGYNWRRVQPALGSVDAAHRLRRSAGSELAVGAAVLLVTAVLVATPPPMDMEAVASNGPPHSAPAAP